MAIPATIRMFKTTNMKVLSGILKGISNMCVSDCYINNISNQQAVLKLNGLETLLNILNNQKLKNYSTMLISEVYLTISMLVLNSSSGRELLSNSQLIKLNKFLNNLCETFKKSASFQINDIQTNKNNSNDDFCHIKISLNCGLAICALCYNNDIIMRKILLSSSYIDWSYFKNVLIRLDNQLKYISNRDSEDYEVYFDLRKYKCFLGFQMAALHNLIENADEDPRAIGMKMIVEILINSENTYLRAICIDYIGRLIRFNDNYIESFICINVIEILCKSIDESDKDNCYNNLGDIEKSYASTTLGYFTNQNAEARRRLIRMTLKKTDIMKNLIYINDRIHDDLLRRWKHLKLLYENVGKKEIMPRVRPSTSRNFGRNNNNNRNNIERAKSATLVKKREIEIL
jgi:hypothetical protein